MCNAKTPTPPKTYEASAPVNGVWTPVQAYTQTQRDAVVADMNRQAAQMPQGDGLHLINPQSIATVAAQSQIADNAGQAAADAVKLASVGRQDSKTVTGLGSKAGVIMGGGASSLVTGGTASSALATRPASTSTLLGG